MANESRYIDALGERKLPARLFDRGLLAEAEDHELQAIVVHAANELNAPIALITLVLDQVQFFKAHYGLPPDLAAARGSRRDASFCQFVVRDGETFELQDAANDATVPQYFVQEYDISAYLGVPIRLEDSVIGSLCVLDTDSRRFSQKEREHLDKLATLVEARVNALTDRRRKVRTDLSDRAAGPALAELSASLLPARSGTQAALATVPAIRSFLNLAAHVLEGREANPEAMKSTLSSAVEALSACEDALYDIDAAAGDCMDCIDALEQLTAPATSVQLSKLLMAAQDLSRPSTRLVGDAPLPDLSFDPLISAPRPLAVALLTAGYRNLADELARVPHSGGISTTVHDRGSAVAVAILCARTERGVLRAGGRRPQPTDRSGPRRGARALARGIRGDLQRSQGLSRPHRRPGSLSP